MSGMNGVSGSGDAGRLSGRLAPPPAGGAAEAAPGYAPDGYTRSAPRVRVGPTPKPALDAKTVGMIAGGAVLAVGAAVLLGGLFLGTPLLGAATFMAGTALGVPAIPLLGLGLSRFFAKREAARVGET